LEHTIYQHINYATILPGTLGPGFSISFLSALDQNNPG